MIARVALIPARSGSQRIPNKNLIEIEGHPLISYSIRSALLSGVFTRVVVSTDSRQIAEIAKKYGAEVPHLRNPEYAKSLSPDFEWLSEVVVDWLGLSEEEVFAILRPTSPLRSPETLRSAMEIFTYTKNIDSVRAVRRVREHPGKMWRLDKEGVIHPYIDGINRETLAPFHSSPLQSLEELWIQDASLEIGFARNVLTHKSISGNRIIGFKMPGYEGFDLNYEEDLMLLKALISTGLARLP
jgi:CMP-N-acetylneuraminic acid synthetase